MGFAYHLVLMNELLAGWRLQEIEAAILAAAALAADGRNDVSLPAHANRIARHLLNDSDEIGFHPAPHIRAFLLPTRIFRLRSNETLYGIGKNYRLATVKNIAVNPVHYHSVALLQLGRKPTFGHRIDSEYIGADAPC